uniref:DUF7710 domain-containing protein n=1 Tax=Actinoplanes regularis TaxID=52697 RepID=UPI000B76E637|nr:hypothetical protein [Actinoplanes regularis]
MDSADAGLEWAAEHRVTGILAEYPFGGAHDVAVSEGRFTPSKAHHGTADHVAAFSPGLQHLHLVDGQQHQAHARRQISETPWSVSRSEARGVRSAE